MCRQHRPSMSSCGLAHAALLRSEKLFLLPLPPAPLLPRRQFCEKEQPLYGWRRAQLHKILPE